MTRCLTVACFVCCHLTSVASADPILTVGTVPLDYVPGGSFTLDVTLSGAEQLNSYFIELFLTADFGVAGVDFFFDDAATIGPSDPSYVFGINGMFFSAVAGVDGAAAVLSLSDALTNPFDTVDTVLGINDLIARVTVRTTGNVGNLVVGINTTTSPPDLLDPIFDPIPDFADLLVTPPQQIAPDTTTAVPEPISLVLLCTGAFGLLGYRRLARPSQRLSLVTKL